ncbi:copper transport protein ctr1 [Actinomortierella ambigua]|nr:copper transport protein ctr1 [Actinomortierella ambigua]
MEADPSSTQSLLVLGAKLGSGTFGIVHQAQYGDQPCAAKAFFVSQSELERKTIDKEISVLQRLRFRHVIQFYRTHEQNDSIYILMELAEKGSLAQAINKGYLKCDDWVTKIRLAHEIAQGLAYIHQEGVLHRDLKSANVLLTKHMEVKLADFGLAQIRSMASTASSVSGQTSKGAAGTLRWLAPELLYAAMPRYSTKSDMYALGMVMWEMAADCTRPFKDQHDDGLIALHVKNGRREQLPVETPLEYRKEVERCWAQDPCDRPNAGNVILVHDESIEESADTDGSFLDFSSGGTRSANASEAYNRGDEGFEQDAIPEDHDDSVGCLPQTDDDVVAYFCTAARAENTAAQLFLGWIYGHGRGVVKSERDSFWWYRKAANGGNVVAQIRLARMYENGQDTVSSNAFKAATWYRRAADNGSAEAQLAIGRMYTEGYGVKEDTSQAARWYEMAAKQGHHEAQTILGQWFALGRGVVQSDEQAVEWLTLAAEQGNPAAQTRLGQMYLDRCSPRELVSSELSGTLSETYDQSNQSLSMAVKWFTRAAEQGNANAQNNLGLMYAQGRGVDQSEAEAAKWFTQAAEQGAADAQVNLGFRYLKGRGVDQSYVEAVKWYTKAAEQGDICAQKNLAWMYELGRGVGRSHVDAAKWYTKAAEQGDANAQYNLAWMYDQGRGVDQSDVDAAKWYTKAAEQGHANAQRRLALMYVQGCGVDQSDVDAAKWYAKAAEQGYPNAQNSLAWMYDRGCGVDQSDAEAVKWYTKAAEQGYANAQFSLGLMYAQGRGANQSEVEAVKWYTEAAEQGYAIAQFNLGLMYDRGRGVDQSDVDAAKWYGRSAAQHDECAQFNIASMYELGLAVDPSGKVPLHLYQEAAAKGEPNAHFHVEWLTSPSYLGGQATTDAQDIFGLYSRGAEQGYAAAQHSLGRMYERGLGVSQDARKAIEWYSKAAARGHTDAKQRMEFLQGHLD